MISELVVHPGMASNGIAIANIDGISVDIENVETNLVFFEIDPRLGDSGQLLGVMSERGFSLGAVGPHRLRVCTHLDVTRDDLLKAAELIGQCVSEGFSQRPSSPAGPYARG